MFNTKSLTTGFVLAVCLIGVTAAAQAETILVANNGVSDSALGTGQVKDVFLGKSAQWSDGSRVILATLGNGATSDEFMKTYVKKSLKQFSTFWKKAVFSGTGEMPASFDTEAELVDFVAKTPGAVGYIDAATAHDGVKVIAIN